MSRTCFWCLRSRGPACYSLAFHKTTPYIAGMVVQPRFQTGEQQTTNLHTSSILLRGLMPIRTDNDGTNLMKKKHVRYSEDYIQEKIEEYKLGVRRLAVMMGRDPKTFTEDDVKHPADLFPREIRVEADSHGRPKNYLFYTMSDLFYEELHFIYSCLLEAQQLDDRNYEKKIAPETTLDLKGSSWMSHDEVKKMFHNIKLPMYNLLISQLSRLAEEPYAYKYKNLIMKYRVVFQVQIAAKLDQLETKVDENGREYSEAQGKRKTAVADVRVYSKGKGRITINGEEFDEFFPLITDRQVVITPFNLLRMNLFFDVEANVRGGLSGIWMSEKGSSPQFPTNPKTSQAGAIRLGIARALQPFVGATNAEILRRAGLLTQDPRKKERKKPGQWKARKKFTWKKR